MIERLKIEDMTLGQIKELKKEIKQRLLNVLYDYESKYDLGTIGVEWETEIDTPFVDFDGEALLHVSHDIVIKFSKEEK